MGTRFQQAIPQQLILQSNPDRFGQPVSKFSFSQPQFTQQLSANDNIQDTFQRKPSQSTVPLSNHFFPSRNNGLLQNRFRDESLLLNLDRFSPVKKKFENR